METCFVQAMKMVDRKLALLGIIGHVYQRMEVTMVEINPQRLSELIYEGERVIAELSTLLDEEHVWLEDFSRDKAQKFVTLKAVARYFKGQRRQRLLAGCAKIDRLATQVNQHSRALADDLQVMNLLNKRYSDFFQQVCPVNLGYQRSGVMNSSEMVFRGHAFNYQV
ncbi:MAG: hypothetical protein ACKVE4_03910 [Dissulfuribacterales bacterium]